MADPHHAYKRDVVMKEHMSRLASQQFGQFQQTTAPLPYIALNSDLPPVELCPKNLITIKQILTEGSEYIHIGKFLLARSVVPSMKDLNNHNATWFVLDDPLGLNALPLFVIARTCHFFRCEINVGTILALMNPLLTTIVNTSSSQIEALLCDNDSHIAVLQQNHPILSGVRWLGSIAQTAPQTASSKWKEEGNQHFKNQKFQEALECYTKAIKEDPKIVMLYSNRSATYAMLDMPNEALSDAEKGLSYDKSNKKLLYRKAKALYLLKKYGDCSSFMSNDPECGRHMADREFAFLLARTNRRCSELKSGDYELLSICNEAKQTSNLDHAEYIDPTLLAIKPVPGYKQGVVLLKSVSAGSLLCAAKAIIYSATQPGYDFHTQMATRLQKDKSLARHFFQLHAGNEIFSIGSGDDKSTTSPDEQRIKQILLNNCFSSGFDHRGVGFWLMPSFINFTCADSNCDRVTIGDFMFVRATKDVAAGEQVLLQMHPTKLTFEQREAIYRERRGYVCKCRLCRAENSETPSIRNRIRYVQAKLDAMEIRFTTVNPIDAIIELGDLLKEMRNLRPNSSLDPLSGQINVVMSKMKVMAGKYKEAVRINKEVFMLWEGFGWLLDNIGLAMALIVNGPMSGSSAEETNNWKIKLKSLAKLYYGDENLLNLLAPTELTASLNPMKAPNGLFGANRVPCTSFRL